MSPISFEGQSLISAKFFLITGKERNEQGIVDTGRLRGTKSV